MRNEKRNVDEDDIKTTDEKTPPVSREYSFFFLTLHVPIAFIAVFTLSNCPSRKKIVSKGKVHQISKIHIFLYLNCTNINNFYSLKVVGRGSDRQL